MRSGGLLSTRATGPDTPRGRGSVDAKLATGGAGGPEPASWAAGAPVVGGMIWLEFRFHIGWPDSKGCWAIMASVRRRRDGGWDSAPAALETQDGAFGRQRG